MKKIIAKIKEIWKLASDFKLTIDIGMIVLTVFVFFRGFNLVLYSIFMGQNIFTGFVSKKLNFKIGITLFFFSIMVGVLLMVLSIEIFRRIDKSYKITLTLLVLNIIIVILGAVYYIEVLFCITSIILLVLLKKHFYREWASKIKRKYVFLIPFTFLFVFMYMLAAPVLQQAFIEDKLISERLFIHYRTFAYLGMIIFIITWLLLGLRNLVVFRYNFENGASEDELKEVDKFLREHTGDVNTHLIFLGDKNLFWSSDKNVLIQYAKIGDVFVSLGDLIGNEEYFQKALGEFQDFADKFCLSTAFYRIDKSKLSVYHEFGYYFFKLGEEAIVDLEEFNLKGKHRQNFRTAKNKFDKSNFKFKMIYPPYDDKMLKSMHDISEEWLNGRNEDGYSIGWFNKDYLEKSSIGIIEDDKGEIIAFASTLPYYDDEETISIDLMRFKKETPNGIMDLLFLNLILWAKENEYKRFSLGMAPLSNVGVSNRSHTGEKFAKFIFNYANKWYNFKGLRYFKNKFDPKWEPHFLAYQKFISLPMLMLNLNKHISKKH